jgi:hypothetical protein
MYFADDDSLKYLQYSLQCGQPAKISSLFPYTREKKISCLKNTQEHPTLGHSS